MKESIFIWIAHNRSIERLSIFGFDHLSLDIFPILAPFKCRIQSLELFKIGLDVEYVLALINGLATNSSVKSLSLCVSMASASGWTIFSLFLSCHLCLLEKTSIFGDGIVDDSAASLGDSVAANQIKPLLMALGWRAFCNGLTVPSSLLLELELVDCSVDDDSAVAIFQALGNITSLLKKLMMPGTEEMTTARWARYFCC